MVVMDGLIYLGNLFFSSFSFSSSSIIRNIELQILSVCVIQMVVFLCLV